MTRASVSARISASLLKIASSRAELDGCTLTSVLEAALERYASSKPAVGGPLVGRLADLEFELSSLTAAPTRAMTWRLPGDLLSRVDARAASERRTRTSVFTEALAAFVAGSPAEVAGRLAVRLRDLEQGAR